MPTTPAISLHSPAATPAAHPLDEFYAQTGLPLPLIAVIDGEEMPEPYKSLLVHHNDMTPTLQAFHQDTIHLRVLRRQHRDGFYSRQVLLLLDHSQTPVEFGAIKINLNLFSPPARRQILEERLPLGHILNADGIPHASRPKAFLRIGADELIGQILNLTGGPILYGRRNSLLDPQQRALAEIVEILPPSLPKHSIPNAGGPR